MTAMARLNLEAVVSRYVQPSDAITLERGVLGPMHDAVVPARSHLIPASGTSTLLGRSDAN
jgi:hypothetical protein